jgi:hypothetical protein
MSYENQHASVLAPASTRHATFSFTVALTHDQEQG